MTREARTVLTDPSGPSSNDHDNIQGDLIVSLNDTITDPKGLNYTIAGCLGRGQFGQVFQVVTATSTSYAMKISPSDARLKQQAHHEVSILMHLQSSGDAALCRISRLVDWFVSRGHVCLVLELLSFDLYTVLQRREFVGLPIPLLQSVTRDLLETLDLLRRCGVVHADLKPENIVLCDGTSTHVKVIDFGSSRTLAQRCPIYVQSRYYRAPEVVLRLPHGPAIDIWSLGCVLCELFMGAPLFGGQNEIQLLEIVAGFLGQIPPEMARRSPRFEEFFLPDATLKTEAQVCREKGIPMAIRHHYLATESSLRDLILGYIPGSGRAATDRRIQRQRRLLFADLSEKMLVFQPDDRISPADALQHPFLTADFVT
jgi:dual specificity protein kinase YAK1